ncbi:acetolactate synthase large subunit [Brevundimonas sp. LM2]|uniref:acetolactate synthase large subunit n=1 Tax=Brevundimonas sp. LM2 TaxID=1938605 RepID=UPI0009839991|nr:acetolactate synthase large subunit [Brevundimonas sp. LM2]AQR62057.1 acetolactate synthase large subunit [Brevundimonas sp. LM2]
MNGAETLVETLADQGVEVCFANPGTSEMHFLAALENPRIRSVLCLFEGVATGAADGWARMKDKPASTLLHLGPGLANGLANIHNARRAGIGMVNVIGEHSTRHLKYDAPLTSDIQGLARPLCHWIRTTDGPQSIARDAAAAVQKASEHPGLISALILPGDASWGDAGDLPKLEKPEPVRRAPDAAQVDHIAKVLKSGEPTLIIFAGKSMRGASLELAGRIAASTGCRIATQFFSVRIERGAGRTPLERIPYAVPQALQFLSAFKHIVTVETGEPIAFFAYPDKPSLLKPAGCQVHELIARDEDSILGLEMLVEALSASKAEPALQAYSDTPMPQGALNPTSIAHALSHAMPENCILVDESLTTGRESMGLTAGARPHDTVQNMGGSIGYGTPVATGAALACPDRRTFCMVGDGSAMYTIQSLWTQAREGLPVTTIIFANNTYAILKAEYSNMGAGSAPGPRALSMIDIDNPTIDWVAMAKSMGVPATSVTNAEDFTQAMINSTREAGPVLIEVKL